MAVWIYMRLDKKKIIALILIITIMIGFILTAHFKYKKPEPKEIDKPAQKSQLFVRPIATKKAEGMPLDSRKKAYSKSLHEGSAVFAGPYRIEAVIYKNSDKQAFYGLYIDNSMAMPVMPKGTAVTFKYKGKEIPLKLLKNGFLFGMGEVPSLPAELSIYGTINNKKFNTILKVENFRTKPITRFPENEEE